MSLGPDNGDPQKPPVADDRSALAKALDLATQVTTICLVLALPALAGYGLDHWLGTGLVFTVGGALFGMASGAWQLYLLVQRMERK